MALFRSGCSSSLTSLFHSSREMRTAKSLGSNVGRLTMARISPLRGSMATMAPFLPSRASSAAICRSMSTVSLSCLPGTAGAVLPHQDLVVLLLDARDADHVAGVIELELRLIQHRLGHFADVADQVSHESVARIEAEVGHDGVEFRQFVLVCLDES